MSCSVSFFNTTGKWQGCFLGKLTRLAETRRLLGKEEADGWLITTCDISHAFEDDCLSCRFNLRCLFNHLCPAKAHLEDFEDSPIATRQCLESGEIGSSSRSA